MKFPRWINASIIVSIVAPATLFCQVPQSNSIEVPCSIHLTRLDDLGKSTEQDKPITIDGRKLLLFGADTSALYQLRKSFRVSKLSNLVVYFPVQQRNKILTIRYESIPKRGYSEQVVKEVPLDYFTLQRKLIQANDPGKNADREDLQKMLLPADRSLDKGKAVLFKNIAYYGLVPESLGFDGDAAVFTSSDLGHALKNYEDLKNAKLDPQTLSVFLGYPDSDEEYKSIFKEDKNGDLRNWQKRSAEVREMKDEFGFKLIANEDYRKMSKDDVLHEMENAKGIVWITAHSHGCFAKFPGIGAIEIAPSDVASLKLQNHPFVVIRICNGEESGFAKAFLMAGASSVWVNHGTIKASDANEQFRLFLQKVKSSTIMDSILAVTAQNESAKYGTALHVFNHPETDGGKRLEINNN